MTNQESQITPTSEQAGGLVGSPIMDRFDMRLLETPSRARPPTCPVRGCRERLVHAATSPMSVLFCPRHALRIHSATRTFVYFNGTSVEDKKRAATRNLWFNAGYFVEHILGNAHKAESHRFCHETSEDALTWNVFSMLESTNCLGHVLRWMLPNMFSDPPTNVELYLWGLRVSAEEPPPNGQFVPLIHARKAFEKGIRRFHTEPDIMLLVPGRALVLVEAKFTSGNTIAAKSGDADGEKPKTRAGILHRYSPTLLPQPTLLRDVAEGPFFTQLYRNLVFAVHMAAEIGTEWAFGNLTSKRQTGLRASRTEYTDPKAFVLSLLPPDMHDRFVQPTWEALEAAVIRPRNSLGDLAEYLRYKSAHCEEAFAISGAAVNKLAAGDAGIASQLTIGHHWPGVPEPER